ncbi:MAG: glucose-6-phosphate dehydrogenase assembly protein OpcA [Microbacteriaceae bacterium]
MILDLPNTTTSAISKTLVNLRDEGGATALGRVLTLIVDSYHATTEAAISAANDASREHPMRVITISRPGAEEQLVNPQLNAQIRIGGDAGASEVIVLNPLGEANSHDAALVTGLLLPDAPVVTWWPSSAPTNVAQSALGTISQRRITDSLSTEDPIATLKSLSGCYTPGDTDLAWTRITNWRAQLAAALDQPPYYRVNKIELAYESGSPSGLLLATWLFHQLDAPVEMYQSEFVADTPGIHGVKLHRENGIVSLERINPGTVRITQPGQPVQEISLPRRELSDCLAEELRRLDSDTLYGEIIRDALPAYLESHE